MRILLPIAALCIAAPLAAVPTSSVPTLAPQLLLGVPQPIAGTAFTITLLVQAPADAAPIPSGSITITWGDSTASTHATLSNSLISAQHTYSASGVFTITASYAGDATYASSSATQTVLALKTAPGAIALSTFGDSITYGDGASAPANDFASLTASTEGWGLKNNGVPGDTSLDTNEYINVKSPQPSFAYNTLLTGENDLRYAMTSSAGEQEYTSAVYADAVWLATTQGSNRITAASSANSTTGSWKASTLYPFTALNSSAAGSTLTGSFTGNIFYAELAATTAAGESVSIAIDGAPPATYSPPPLDYIGVRINYGPYFIRTPLTGANSSTHSVRFTCIAPGPNGCEVVWFAGNGLTNLSAPPYLWLATPYFTAQPGYPQSEYIQMAQIVRNIQAQLSADGLPVFLADLANTFNGVTNSACMADEVHPSDCGHAILAATFINSMNRLLVTSTRSLAYASLAAAANPISIGQNATLTATVTAGYGVPTGAVSFYSGSLLLASQTLVSGAASYTASTANLPAGMYPVTATYSGDSNYDPATSEPYNITISRASTSTTVNASPATVTPPSSTLLTAQVARTAGSGTPAGTVTFYSATLPIGSATLNANGTATLSAATSGIPSGTYPVTAKYSGDNSDSQSTSASVKVTVK